MRPPPLQSLQIQQPQKPFLHQPLMLRADSHCSQNIPVVSKCQTLLSSLNFHISAAVMTLPLLPPCLLLLNLGWIIVPNSAWTVLLQKIGKKLVFISFHRQHVDFFHSSFGHCIRYCSLLSLDPRQAALHLTVGWLSFKGLSLFIGYDSFWIHYYISLLLYNSLLRGSRSLLLPKTNGSGY